MYVSHGLLSSDSFYFALPHAVTLAEAGRSIGQKRIGYLFCAEVMPPDHELQLMLVNTLRKDLEHEDVPRICLALDNVIASSNEDLIPAIQARLHDLLSHNSSIEEPIPKSRELVNELFVATLNISASYKSGFIAKILSALHFVGLSENNIATLLRLIRSSSKKHDRGMSSLLNVPDVTDPKDPVVLRGAFALLATVDPARLLSAHFDSPIRHIRSLLTSRDPNDIYLFLICLECLDPVLWAGTSGKVPPVLEGWEVERIMQLLDSSDLLIRKTTIKLLSRVDMGIVSSYYSRAVQNIPTGLSLGDLNSYGLRIIEVLIIQSGEDGELFARELKDLLLGLEQASPDGQPVLEAVVDSILTHLHHAAVDFGIGFSTAMLTSVVEPETNLSQTTLVIVAALATEQCGKLAIRPLDILEASVKDACLIAMLRVAAECDNIPSAVIDAVTELGQRSKRHLRQRCEQFTSLVANKHKLIEIVNRSRSSSLPDFLTALVEANNRSPPPAPPTTLSVPSGQSLSASKLRYDAYDTPVAAPKLRNRDVSRSPGPAGMAAGREPRTRVNSGWSDSSADSLSKTLTPGELTLAASRQDLNIATTSQVRSPGLVSYDDNDKLPKILQGVPKIELSKSQSIEDLASRVDLITLDSPFVSDPSEVSGSEIDAGIEFERLWNSSMDDGDLRGWFNGSVAVAIERLQGLSLISLRVISVDLPPYPGDLKVIVSQAAPGQPQAVLRLKESEDDSCLWRLRCSEDELRVKIKGQLG
ncbi:hypothetical protein DXG01_010157 [Tephrocybe rancida]|nr:hypothetical protein DXG01_010157 [Tephrocybe rancida]